MSKKGDNAFNKDGYLSEVDVKISLGQSIRFGFGFGLGILLFYIFFVIAPAILFFGGFENLLHSLMF